MNYMGRRGQHICDALLTILLLGAFFALTLWLDKAFPSSALIPSIFVLCVFLVSLVTNGYFYGIFAAMISVLAVNYAFTFPFFAFNFSIKENFISAVILITITVITSTLTTKAKGQKRLKREAEREKMRADLLRAISHDIRTPLTTIYGSGSALLENYDTLSKESRIKIIEGINSDAQWLIRMVENLLSVTQMDGHSEIVKFPIAAEELIDAALTKFKKHYPERNVTVEMPDEFIMILADPLLVQQVLVNFLENAVIHAEGMTELGMRVYTKNGRAYFEVRDNGCGIPKERLKGIFFGGSASDGKPIDSKKRCMGIGLSLCRAIINAHSGNVYARNLKGGGMCFGFVLDMAEVEDE